MYKKKPFFIVFEGVEGCGKSYQSKKLYNRLKKYNIDTILTREPGGTKSSELIRNLILKDYFIKNSREKFDKYTDTLLYLAARNEHIKNKIKPALIKNKVVICDRFIDSTIAYQHYGMGLNLKIIKSINHFLLDNIKIDFTFINLVSKKNMKLRLSKRKNLNRYDKFKTNFYDKVQNGFIKIAKNKTRNYMKINSNLNVDTNKKLIIDKIDILIK